MSLKIHSGVFTNRNGSTAILTETGKLHMIGNPSYGGWVQDKLNDISDNIVKVVMNDKYAFTALRKDGTVITWGRESLYNYDIKEENKNYVDIFSGKSSFGGLKSNGKFYVWGNSEIYNDWTEKFNDNNSKIIQVANMGNYGWILLKQDGTLAHIFEHSNYNEINRFINTMMGISNIKKIGSGNTFFAALTHSGYIHVFNISGYYLDSGPYGIRGLDGLVGDPSVVTNGGIKDIFFSNSYLYILKEDGSVHIVGIWMWANSNYKTNWSLKQYEKMQSNVVDIYVQESDRFFALKDDDSIVCIDLDHTDKINKELVNIDKVVNIDFFINKDGKLICRDPDKYYFDDSVQNQLSSGVVDMVTSNTFWSTFIWCVALKDDGSIVSWGHPDNNWGDHKTKIKDHDGNIDSTLGDSGVVKIYACSKYFLILKDDGKFYAWGYGGDGTIVQDYFMNNNVRLNDISSYAENNGFKKNNIKPIYNSTSITRNPNLYNDIESNTSLNKTNYNSDAFAIAGTLNGFTTFSPGLTNSDLYIYNDKTNMGIIENNNIDIKFTINNGLNNSAIQSILNHNLSLNSTFTFSGSHYTNQFTSGSYEDNHNKKLKRMQVIRTLFQNNYNVNQFITNKTSLGLNSDYFKTNFKVMHTLNSTEINYSFYNDTYITETSGFYIYMDENSKSNIQINSSTTLNIECTGSDNSNNLIYYINTNKNKSGILINYTNSTSYINDSYPAGPFKDGDKIIMENIIIHFDGGIIENNNSIDIEKYSVEKFVPYIEPIGNKIPIFCGWTGFMGIAKNNYLYSWGSGSAVIGSKDENNEWTNSTTNRVTDISNVYMGAQNSYAVLLKNGKISTDHYRFPELDDEKNVWYDNGVKKNDLSEINDAVEIFCIFNDEAHGTARNSKAIILRQDGSIALWANRDDIKHHNTDNSLTAATIEEYTLRSTYAKRLMDSTDPNFSKIIKICRGTGGYVILREDGRIALIQRPHYGHNYTHMGLYPSWNRRQSNDYHHSSMKPTLEFTLGNEKKTLGEFDLTAQDYFGKVIDIGTFGWNHVTQGMWYVLNERGQFFIFRDYYQNTSYAAAYYPPVDICYGDKSLEDPTTSPYFKKTIKVYTTYYNHYPEWLIIFEDGTALTSRSETHNSNRFGFIDIFTKYTWYYDSNNPSVKGVDPNDDILIDQYYGPYILLKNGYLRNISYTISNFYYNNNPYQTQRYFNWNHHQYGIKGTGMGYPSGEPEYGDISGVKQILFVGQATLCVKTDGTLLVWGNNSGNNLKIGNNTITSDITDHFTNVNKVVSNMYSIAILKNNGSVFVWGHASYGGDINTTVPVGTEGMNDYTLDTGVIDLFASAYTYTAVKSDGLITWGHSSYVNPGNENTGHTLDALANIGWETKSEGYNYRTYKHSFGIGGSNSTQNLHHNEYNYLDYPKYKTNTTIESLISQLISEGVDQDKAESFSYFPKNVTNFNLIKINEEFYKGLSKDNVRDILIKLFFNLCPTIKKFQAIPETFALDGKINKLYFDIIKPNSGVINLRPYQNKTFGFYILLEDTDITILKYAKDDIAIKFTKNETGYHFEKIYGTTDLSSNKTSPVTSKVNINNFDFNFKNGIYTSMEESLQKYNCIATTLGAAAYLTSSGKVITWGLSNKGGFSHHENIFTNYSSVLPSTSFDIQETQENLISDVVDIVSNENSFIAVKKDGSFVQWGYTYNKTDLYYGGNYNYYAYPHYHFSKKKVDSVYTNKSGSYAVLLNDKSVITFGNTSNGGYHGAHNENPLVNIVKIFPLEQGFAALNTNSELFTWGSSQYALKHRTNGVYSDNFKNVNNLTSFVNKLPNIAEFYANYSTCVAIDKNGHIFTWGSSSMGVYPDVLKVAFNTRRFVNVISTQYNHAAIDENGGVVCWGTTYSYNHWLDISGELQSGVTRIFASDYDFFCLKEDNTLIGVMGRYSWDSGVDFSNNDIQTSSSFQVHLPPSEYIIGRYKLKNIKDVFSSKYGWAAIDTSDNVICWGHVENQIITNINQSKIHGGTLSGTEENLNRPVAIFTNGMTWACLKEDETVVTWEGTNSNAYGTTAYQRGADYNHPTYGINGVYWGGNGNGGAVRGGNGTIRTLKNVKNIIPYGNLASYGGYIAICEDPSGNQSVVQWGSDNDTTRWKYTTPNSNGRAFRHVCEELTDHSKEVIGIKNNAGAHYGWKISNNENLHEYNFGEKNFTDIPTGFGLPLQTVEVISSEDVIADILKDICDNEIDIDTKFFEEAVKEENKLSEDIDEDEAIPDNVAKEEQTKISKIISLDKFKTNPKQLRKQRVNQVRLVFANNPKRNKFRVANVLLGDSDPFKKTNSIIYRVNFGKAEVNLKEDPNISESTGFYVPLQDGDELTMTNFRGDSKFKITRSEDKFDDGSSKYFVDMIDGYDHSITLYRSGTYIPNSRPQGPFHEEDRARIAGVDVEFGSVMEGSPNYSFGDPYINPLCGYPTKLPDKNAIYRMVEGFGLYINASVQKLSEYKQNKMKKWFYNKAGYSAESVKLITDGYYYDKFFISSENHNILFDLNKETIFVKSHELEYFDIKNNYEYEKQCISLKEKCNKYTITWNHKIFGKIQFFIKIYENPQLDNGISIDIEQNAVKCKGMLIKNYKPNLMLLDNIKEKKSNKLKRRLRKSKNKFATKNIIGKNELWLNVKNN